VVRIAAQVIPPGISGEHLMRRSRSKEAEMSDREQANEQQAADDANEAARDSTEHPEAATAGVLDEEKLREHADRVSEEIQEAKSRNP